jgi:gliding motility-associated-like protein
MDQMLRDHKSVGKSFISILIMLAISIIANAQVDTEFWFAPPEVSSGHGDSPFLLRISTLHQAATVQVFQPARANARLANVQIAANSTRTIDLSSFQVEPLSPASVQQNGIRIISTALVSAYYEVVGGPNEWNTDIFTLKGKNGLGNRFMIPGQDLYDNGGHFYPAPYSSFDVIATENNTILRVKPTRPIFGHEKDTLITVMLNKGETYSFQKTSQLAQDNPIGSVVESNKPIAITLKDDSAFGYDLLGDQLVPIEVTGSEYVVMKGFLNNSGGQEFLFVTAIENDTELFVDDGGSPVAILASGELYRVPLSRKATYVRSDRSFYAVHVTGVHPESGMAILPAIACRGSNQIGFSKTANTGTFALNILVRKEGINGFKLNGSSTLVPANSFTPVRGTKDTWYAAQIILDESQVKSSSPNLLSNSDYSFQLGIIHFTGPGCRYGYFSAFSTLFIGDDLTMCEGETATLDAGSDKDSYLWSNGSTKSKISISDPGIYSVMTQKGDCILYDTIKVKTELGNKINLGPDVEICYGDTAVVDGKDNFSWTWSNGSTNRFLKTSHPGKYSVSVMGYSGCSASDTIVVKSKNIGADLGADITKCPKEEVVLNATIGNATYVWNDGTTSPLKVVKNPGVYWCKTLLNGCASIDSLTVQNLPGPPQDSISGSSTVCPSVKGVEYRVEESSQASYQWYIQGGIIENDATSVVKVDWDGANNNAMVKAVVTNSSGCIGDTLFYPVRINVRLAPRQPDGIDTVCFNLRQNVIYKTSETNGSSYHWSISGGEISHGQRTSTVVVNWNETGPYELQVNEESITFTDVCAGESPVLKVLVFKDSASFDLQLVTAFYDFAANGSLLANWWIENPGRFKNDLIWFRWKDPAESDYIDSLSLSIEFSRQEFTDPGFLTSTNDFQLSALDVCGNYLKSSTHENIVLSATTDSLANIVALSWNEYKGWLPGVDSYKLWAKFDKLENELIATLSEGQNLVATVPSTTAFTHQYWVEAIGRNQQISLSNKVDIEFDHPVWIPNVITPNNDGFNDHFTIRNIKLYSQNRLIVYDRWGKVMYETSGYNNSWTGGDLASGVYFYELNLITPDITYRGTLSILH